MTAKQREDCLRAAGEAIISTVEVPTIDGKQTILMMSIAQSLLIIAEKAAKDMEGEE